MFSQVPGPVVEPSNDPQCLTLEPVHSSCHQLMVCSLEVPIPLSGIEEEPDMLTIEEQKRLIEMSEEHQATAYWFTAGAVSQLLCVCTLSMQFALTVLVQFEVSEIDASAIF